MSPEKPRCVDPLREKQTQDKKLTATICGKAIETIGAGPDRRAKIDYRRRESAARESGRKRIASNNTATAAGNQNKSVGAGRRRA